MTMYKLALFIAALTFTICICNGISIYAIIFRTAIVYLGVLTIIYLANVGLQLGFFMVERKPDSSSKR